MADKFIVLVTSAAQVAVRNPSGSAEVQTVENSGPATAFVGQTGVTTGTGLPFPPGSKMELIKNGTAIFAITAAGPPANLLVSAGIALT
jgi:hypothetical protein